MYVEGAQYQVGYREGVATEGVGQEVAETGRQVTGVRMATVVGYWAAARTEVEMRARETAKEVVTREVAVRVAVAKEEAARVVAVAPVAHPKVSRVGTSVTEGADWGAAGFVDWAMVVVCREMD